MEPATLALYTMPGSPVRTLAGLEGKTAGVTAETAAVMALDSYPVSAGPPGPVDVGRLERVADVMREVLSFPSFDIKAMLLAGG